MAQVLVLYNTPVDAAAFDHYYHTTHVPLANTIPGLRSYVINANPVHAMSGTAPYLVAELTFDSMAEIQAALMSPQGQAAAADLPNFATGGVTLLMFETKNL